MGTWGMRSGSQLSWSRVFTLWMLTSSSRLLSVHSSAAFATPATTQPIGRHEMPPVIELVHVIKVGHKLHTLSASCKQG